MVWPTISHTTDTSATPPPAEGGWRARLNQPAVRLTIGLVLLAVIGWQVYRWNERGDWGQALPLEWTSRHSLLLAVVIALMPVNWLLETQKWRKLLAPYWVCSFRRAAAAILAGISVSLLTPNRIGEYGGRLWLTPPEQSGVVALTTLVGSVCQWIGFILLGWPALLYCMKGSGRWSPLLIGLLLVGMACLALVLVMAWRYGRPRASSLPAWLQRLPYIAPGLNLVGRLPVYIIAQASLIAAVRVVVYSTQYYLLLCLFGMSVPWIIGIAGSVAVFFLQAGLPMPPGLGVLTRTEISLLVWGAAAPHPTAVLCASFLLFAINLGLPALLGAALIVKTNVFKSLEYEKFNA